MQVIPDSFDVILLYADIYISIMCACMYNVV